MKSSRDETLNRLVKRLSAQYDHEIPYEAAHKAKFTSLPLHWGPELCSFPCLSISSSSHEQQQQQQSLEQQEVLQPIDLTKKLTKAHHEEFINLMSRKARYRQHSIPLASYSILRNLISTFGDMLELQIQRMIYNIMESKNRAIMSNNNNHKKEDEEVFQKFAELPTNKNSNGSLVVPLSAWTNFSTMLPMEHWQEMIGYDNVSLRVIFQAEIVVRIIPNDTIHTVFIKAPGLTVGVFANNINHMHSMTMNSTTRSNSKPESLDVDINTKALYNSMRRECKAISKQVMNAIAGFELMKPKIKPSIQRHVTGTSTGGIGGTGLSHNKTFTMNSDGATYKTEKTTISSQDGRDCRSASLSIDEYYIRDHKASVGTNTFDHISMGETGPDDVTPRKKTKSSKFDYQSHEPLTGDTKSTESSSVDHISVIYEQEAIAEQDTDFSIIYGQESTNKIAKKKSKKKKEHNWKRFLSPQKTDESSDQTSSLDNRSDNDTSEKSSEKKSKKKIDHRWKGMFASSKQ
jgi:hypothetical protein